ncbi:LRRC57 (predicted) [Pycnogonum litorale]
MGNTLKPHIENAEKTGAFQYCNKSLAEFPSDLQKLSKHLRTLDLSSNKISSIPRYISSFTSLKCLTLNNNRIAVVPEELGSLKKLETLSLNSNSITSLPKSFDSLKNIRNLSLSRNRLSSFPVVVCKLRHLEVLDLSGNKISEIPEEASGVQASEINLNENQVSLLSGQALCSCSRLKILRLEENCLELAAITPEILKNSTISLLALDGNLFEIKKLRDVDGYEEYMERFTAAKKKMY